MREICNALEPVKFKWFKLGVQCGIAYHKLKEFSKEEDPLTAIIDYCLKGNVENVPLCWEAIVTALESPQVGEPGVARDIQQKYCQLKSSKAQQNTST